MSNESSSTIAIKVSGNGNRRRSLLWLLAAVVIVAAIAWTLWYFLDGRWYAETEDAYVDGNIVQITPQIAGTVVSIAADDGNRVQAGQVLVELESSDADVALAQARAALAQAVRRGRGLFSTVDSGQADLAARNIALTKARADVERRSNLVASGAVSAEELSHARDALAAAESALAASQGQLNTSKALIDDTTIAALPDVQLAAAKLRAAMLDRARTQLIAPVSGYVAKRTVQVGQRVQPGAALMAVVPLDQLWVDANFKETQLRHMRIGQPVTLESDLYGSDAIFHGHVESLGVGTGSAFSLLPAQNASGNWIKIVQRVPVRVGFDPQELARNPLRVGLSISASVDLHDQSGSMLAQKTSLQPAFSTDIYSRQLGDADAQINQIIDANLARPSTAAKR
ncbi:MAG: efflux RND transporter periplasmic adaptor subunit [Dokdonella sp.]